MTAKQRENVKLSKMSKSESHIKNRKRCSSRGGTIIERNIGDSHLVKPKTTGSEDSSSTLKVSSETNYDKKCRASRENIIDGMVNGF